MKRTLIVLMSAAALLLFVALHHVFGWSTSCSTTYSGGQWHDCTSGAVEAQANGTGTFVTLAAWVAERCTNRVGKIWKDGDSVPFIASQCPWAESDHTPQCCVKYSFTIQQYREYWVQASQSSTNPQGCGPVTAIAQSTDYTCIPTGSEGP